MVAGVPGILQDTAPYAGGAVHARPQAEAGLREFFHSMYIADDPPDPWEKHVVQFCLARTYELMGHGKHTGDDFEFDGFNPHDIFRV